jgi:hypothetical protein
LELHEKSETWDGDVQNEGSEEVIFANGLPVREDVALEVRMTLREFAKLTNRFQYKKLQTVRRHVLRDLLNKGSAL